MILCVLINATLTPLQGFLGFIFNIIGLDAPNFVGDILGFFGC